MSEDKLDIYNILEYLKNMTNRQHAILGLLHNIEDGVISEFGEKLKDLEHWSIEGLEIIPRSLVLKLIKEYEEMLK